MGLLGHPWRLISLDVDLVGRDSDQEKIYSRFIAYSWSILVKDEDILEQSGPQH